MNSIVAVDQNWGIGKDNQLLFSIPEDMAYFRETTKGKVVVMGRSTMESLPGGKPLKNRVNLLLTRKKGWEPEGFLVYHSLEELWEGLKPYPDEDVFVIGGGQVYKELLPYCAKAYITKVAADGGADRHFPNLDEMESWELEESGAPFEASGMEIAFCVYRNRALEKPGQRIK